MFMDERTEFCDEVDVSAAAGTAQVGDIIDMEVVRDIGNGQPIYLVISTGATEIITGGSAGTLKFQLASNSLTTLTADGTDTVHLQTDELVTDDTLLIADQFRAGGVIYMAPIPLEGVPYERYLGILAVTATTTTTAGTINAYLTLDPRGWKAYADADN